MAFALSVSLFLAVFMCILLALSIKESLLVASSYKKNPMININDEVAESMAQKIIADAEMHRKNRFMEDE